MPDKYLTLISSLLSGLIGVFGALAGVYLNNRNQRAERASDRRRERGEELYSTTVEWLNGLFFFTMRRCAVMRQEITYNQCLDQDIQWGKDRNRPALMLRFEMLIDVYFPTIRTAYDVIVELRTQLNDVESAFKNQYASDCSDGRVFLRPYIELQERIGTAGDTLKELILTEIRKIG